MRNEGASKSLGKETLIQMYRRMLRNPVPGRQSAVPISGRQDAGNHPPGGGNGGVRGGRKHGSRQ